MATTNTFRGAPEQARQRRQAAGRAALRGTPAPDDDVQWFDLRSVPAMPWKNGGGSTRELACWPPGADTSGFDWRVSVASIAAAGPFSVFAGVDRNIMLLDGDGVHLAQPVDDSAARAERPFTSTEDLALRAQLDRQTLQHLAAGDALHSLAGHRRQQVWAASALHTAPALLRGAPVHEPPLALPQATEGEAVVHDYASLGLTLRQHPLALLRPQLAAQRLRTAAELRETPDGRLVRACGLVTTRQRPATAKGVVFVTLEDETGTVQVIVWRALRERQRNELTGSRLLGVHGVWQRDGAVCNLIAGRLENLNPLLGRLAPESRDFH